MKLSKSKVNSYLKCPREFKFQYIDEIETKPNKYMALGSDVHLIAEKFTDKFEDDLDDVILFTIGECFKNWREKSPEKHGNALAKASVRAIIEACEGDDRLWPS